MAKKSEPLSLESLLEAQQRMLTASNLSEEQRKRAEDQIAKLEELRKATTETQEKQTEVVEQVKVMTKPKGDSKNVTLGDVRTELKEMRKDLKTFAGKDLKTFAGKDPNPSRKPLLRQRDDVIDVDAKEVPEQSLNAQREERAGKLSNIGATLGEKAELYQKGAGKEVTMAKNTEAFERFVAETKKKDELLKDATDDQIKLFERLEDTLIKLRDSDAKDSAELRKELAKIAGELETTGDTAAKSKIGGVLENTRNRARSGARGDAGTLGDAWSALTGKQKVLKEGYEFDPRMGENAVRRTKDNELGKAGRLAQKGEVVSMGRIAGAAKIAGNFFRGKVEDYNAKNASNLGSDFLDRTFGGNRLEEDRARLGARAEALTQSRGGQTAASPTPVPAGRGQPMAMPKSGAMNITATVVNLRGPLKLPASGGPGWSAGNTGAGGGKDWPPKPTVTATTPAPMAAAAKPEEETGGGLGLGDIMRGGGRLLGRAGSGIMSAGRGALNLGRAALGTTAGATVAAGAAMYGASRLVDYGAGKLGVGKDEKGEDLKLDTKADDSNWNRMSWFEKAQSGMARGIEKVGGFVAPNMANQAAADRIKKESEYFANKDKPTVTPTTNMAAPMTGMEGAAPAPMTGMQGAAPNRGMSSLSPEAQRALAPRAPGTAPAPAPKPVATVKPVDKPAAKETDYTKDPRYQKLYEEQDVARKEKYVKLYGEDVGGRMAAEPMNAMEQRNLDMATKERYMETSNQTSKKIDGLSKTNAVAKEANNKPVVINQPAAPAPAPAPAPANNMMVPRGQVRSTESAMERYSTRNAHFY
jgi:hypothetical protein